MDRPVTGSLPEASIRPEGFFKNTASTNIVKRDVDCPMSNCFANENTEAISSPYSGCVNTTSILLEPSEYFFDDDFAVPFDANLRDETALHHRGLIEDSDEGISSSGTTNRGLMAPPHSRSDSCLFSQPDSGDSGQGGAGADMERRFESPVNSNRDAFSRLSPQNNICCPDSTSASNPGRCAQRIHRTMSADFSTALHDLGGMDKLFDTCAITFSEVPQLTINGPSSLTGSWMQAILEGSSCPQLKELLKRTAEALDYRLAWGELQTGAEDGAVLPLVNASHRFGRIQRSTSHGNIFTAASLAGMRQALANIKITAPKEFRSIGVSTSDCSCDDTSLPDTTTTTTTTTWARIRSSRESLNSKKAVVSSDTPVNPSLPNLTRQVNIPEAAVTWRAVKEVAGSEMTTWGQLRRTASLGNRNAKHTPAKTNKLSSNLHGSLMSCDFNISLRPPVSQKAMHRYSGTLLEIFMRARARDLASSSYISSQSAVPAEEATPRLLKRLGPSLTGDSVSTSRTMCSRSLQTNTLMVSLGTETEHMPIKRDNQSAVPWLRMTVPPPKTSSQPPRAPPRKSSVTSPKSRLYVNLSCGNGVTYKPYSPVPPMSLLTTSADPESECMSRLREGSPFSHIKNPRAAIVYPGLGRLAIPKPSRIESNTFLSQTLPDLSLLGKAAAQEAKSGTPTTKVLPPPPLRSRRSVSAVAVCRRVTNGGVPGGRGTLSTCRNTGIEAIRRRISGIDGRRVSDVQSIDRPSANLTRKSTLQANIFDRPVSEPSVANSQQKFAGDMMATSLNEEEKAPGIALDSLRPCRPRSQSTHCKKSVSFNGNMHQLPGSISPCLSPPCVPDARRYGSPDPKVIPRNWGLYGQDPPPLAVFQLSHDDQNNVSSTTRPSDVDLRYQAMVMDVIKAVQETIAYFCQPATSLTTTEGSKVTEGSSIITDSSTSADVTSKSPVMVVQNYYSSLAALGSSGRSSLLTVVNPLMVLVSDGLLPPQTRAIFASKPKSRIWALVEDSCRPSPYLGKIEHHIVTEVLNQVKSLTGAITEKVRFKAFVCGCLNQRALLLWLNSLVSNEPLLKRYYCDGAFIRQCRTTLRGLYADLTTHVEQLLNYPFNFDLAAEAKRPAAVAASTGSLGTPVRVSKSATRKADQPSGDESKGPRTTFGRASSAAPACTVKSASKASSNGRPTSTTKATDTKMVQPRVKPTTRRTPVSSATSLETQHPNGPIGPSSVAPIKPNPLSSPSASVMRGKLRTAFST
uniref:RUN domain-containing protein n=1 Tax=Mesocestoides corti TaxID=53468 RepID=A0A5K3F3E7_MESCO